MSEWHPLDRDDPPAVSHDNSDVTNDDLLAMLGGTMIPRDIVWRRQREASEARRAEILKDMEAHLQTMDTRALIKALRDGQINGESWIDGLGYMGFGSALEKYLRAVLATRPHIPNKVEAKILRRQAAQKHHGKRK